MKLSQTTSRLFNCFSYEEGMRVAAEAGFDALDLHLVQRIYNEEFSEENIEATCKMLKETAEKHGLIFNQAHAPYPCYMCMPDKEKMDAYNKKTKDGVIRSIKAAALVGASVIVVHPIDYPDKEKQKQFNIDFYNSLLPYCKEYGIKIALENMWTYNNDTERKIVPNVCSYAKDLAEYYDELNPEYFTICLDLGHSGLVGENAENAIRVLGKERLGALHVHDNDNYVDMHTLPYSGEMNWNEIMKALSDIEYMGDFTFEVTDKFLWSCEDKPELMKYAFKLLAATGKHLINKINK